MVTSPKSASMKIDQNDSTYLKIYLQKSNYKVTFLAKSLKTYDINEIDKFIAANKSQINAKKIFQPL